MMNLILLMFVAGIAFTLYSVIKKRELNKAAVGRRVFLEYGDQSDAIKIELPRTGTIQRALKIGNRRDNFVVKLDTPMVTNGSNFDEIVIREKILGNYVGSNKRTAVYVLLPKQRPMEDSKKWESFDLAGWLTVQMQ